MKKLIGIIFLLPLTVAAQNFQGMSEQDMQKMMQQMQKMQTCMQGLDQAELKALEQRSNKFEADIRALCASGKRDKAQKKAIAFGKEISKSPVMKTMKKCADMAEGIRKKRVASPMAHPQWHQWHVSVCADLGSLG